MARVFEWGVYTLSSGNLLTEIAPRAVFARGAFFYFTGAPRSGGALEWRGKQAVCLNRYQEVDALQEVQHGLPKYFNLVVAEPARRNPRYEDKESIEWQKQIVVKVW